MHCTVRHGWAGRVLFVTARHADATVKARHGRDEQYTEPRLSHVTEPRLSHGVLQSDHVDFHSEARHSAVCGVMRDALNVTESKRLAVVAAHHTALLALRCSGWHW
jgi:hypothetical protein